MATRQRNDRQMLRPPSVRVLLPSRARIPTTPLMCGVRSLQEHVRIRCHLPRLAVQQLLDLTRPLPLVIRLRQSFQTRMSFAGARNSWKQCVARLLRMPAPVVMAVGELGGARRARKKTPEKLLALAIIRIRPARSSGVVRRSSRRCVAPSRAQFRMVVAAWLHSVLQPTTAP